LQGKENPSRNQQRLQVRATDLHRTDRICDRHGGGRHVLMRSRVRAYAQRERGRLRAERLRAPDERKTVTGLGAEISIFS
jgi:hypothetical protein